jgi:hypothetical protein
MKVINSRTALAWAAALAIIMSRCEYCHRSMALRHLFARKAGIRLHDRWYCSLPCFTSAAEGDLSGLSGPGLGRPSHNARMPVELILMSRGLLTKDQVREVIEEQKEVGGEIDELLVRLGSVSEKQLTAAHAAQWGCPVFTVPKQPIQTGIHIPSTFIHAYSLIPLHHAAASNLLLVGFVHGIEYGLLYAIEQVTRCKTLPCFVTPSDFQIQVQQRDRALEGCRDTTPKEVKFESVQTPAEMARVLCGYCIELEAEEAMIGKCTEYFWARLKRGPKEVDLLFKAG